MKTITAIEPSILKKGSTSTKISMTIFSKRSKNLGSLLKKLMTKLGSDKNVSRSDRNSRTNLTRQGKI